MAFGTLLSGTGKTEEFVAKIVNNPNDLNLREQYADSLIKEGDSYGEFIYASMMDDKKEAKALLTEDMLKKHFSTVYGLVGLVNLHDFRVAIDNDLIVNGFLEKLHINLKLWVKSYKDILAKNPIKYLYTNDRDVNPGKRSELKFGVPNLCAVLKDSFKNLEFLGLEYALLGDTNLKTIIDSFRHIKKLNLGFNMLTSKGIKLLVQELDKPTYLDLHNNYFSGRGTKLIADGLESLEYLNIDNCSSSAYDNEGNEGTHGISDADIVYLVSRLTNLKALHINHLWGLTDNSVEQVGYYLPNLESFSIAGNHLTEESAKIIATRLRKLKELEIYNSYTVVPDNSEALFLIKNMPYYNKKTFLIR